MVAVIHQRSGAADPVKIQMINGQVWTGVDTVRSNISELHEMRHSSASVTNPSGKLKSHRITMRVLLCAVNRVNVVALSSPLACAAGGHVMPSSTRTHKQIQSLGGARGAGGGTHDMLTQAEDQSRPSG